MNTRSIVVLILALSLSGCHEAVARSGGARRALLIGINDYSASSFDKKMKSNLTARDWRNLRGAVRDVEAMEELLIRSYGFRRGDIVKLTDQEATRKGILETLEQHLVQPAAAGDVMFLYFAGHGSQVTNSLSDEPDRLDESIIPADSLGGADDIRDKELRPYFNRILDQRASLTILLDSCHSASGARAPSTDAIARGIAPDRRDVADATDYGPRPEQRGAIVLAATQDFDRAWERPDERGRWHGTFSWAWLRSAREAAPGESVGETFQRAHARMAAETPWQEPILGANAAAQQAPFLRMAAEERRDVVRVAVQHIAPDGTVILDGGWADGLSVGSALRIANRSQPSSRLTVTAIEALGQSTARLLTGDASSIAPGTLLEVAGVERNMNRWMVLDSPPQPRWPYTLAVRSRSTDAWVDREIVGGECYDPILRPRSPLDADVAQRHVYLFVIDSRGTSTLLYPRNGSVENRFPLARKTRPAVIPLGRTAAFCGAAPYGTDTYILLTTDEPLANPFVLQGNGARGALADENLTALLGSSQWSIERFIFLSRPPQKSSSGVS